MKPETNETNQSNANKGTSGTNPQYDKAQGNKGKQLDPKQGGKDGSKSGGKGKR